MSRRSISVVLWIVAVVLAVALAVVQRMTGPSYPVKGSVGSGRETVGYRLPRSHGGPGGLPVALWLPSSHRDATLMWRRYPTDDPWHPIPMLPTARGTVAAEIPHQPPAGKVEYWILVDGEGRGLRVPADESVVARFRGSVPAAVLIPHIVAMFASLLVATRALLEVVRPPAPAARGLILVSMALLLIGGLVLGPLVQRAAFGALWTGWPLGTDLTDNKTLVAVLAWIPAVVAAIRRRWTRTAVILGWIVLVVVFSIPHSMRGSQLDWEEVPAVEISSP